LREEHRLRVSENRVLRKIFGPKRDEVTGEWRRLHNEDLHDLYFSSLFHVIKSRRMRWAEHVFMYGVQEMCIQGSVGETWRKETTLKTCRRWRIILKWMCKKLDGQAWTRLIWLSVERGGEL